MRNGSSGRANAADAAVLAAVSLMTADAAMRQIVAKTYDAAFDASNRSAVRMATRALRTAPFALYEAIRTNATRSAR